MTVHRLETNIWIWTLVSDTRTVMINSISSGITSYGHLIKSKYLTISLVISTHLISISLSKSHIIAIPSVILTSNTAYGNSIFGVMNTILRSCHRSQTLVRFTQQYSECMISPTSIRSTYSQEVILTTLNRIGIPAIRPSSVLTHSGIHRSHTRSLTVKRINSSGTYYSICSVRALIATSI